MFVSSYSTYVTTNLNDKVNKSRFNEQKQEDKSFSKVLSKTPPLTAYDTKNIPINYISNYKSFANKQKLQDSEIKSKDEVKFKKMSDKTNAKVSYESNTHMFSLVSIPKVPINQVAKISENYPQNIQDIKEQNKKYEMVNTYLANDKYYQITA